MIRKADHFVFLDDVQFTKRDWRSRNRIVSPNGPQWLTVPVITKGRYTQTIAEAELSDPDWWQGHLQTMTHAWARAPRFAAMFPLVKDWYAQIAPQTHLAPVNTFLIRQIMGLIGLDTTLHNSADLPTASDATERLLVICQALGASTYLSGPAARDYLDTTTFEAAGIAVDWMTYGAYPEYVQADGGYEPAVSILDALMWLEPEHVLGPVQ